MTDRFGLTTAELEVWDSFCSMRRTLDRALDLQLKRDSRISASEYEVLLGLLAAPGAQLRVTDIAARIGWENSRVSHLVARMEKRSLLNRTDCESDARGSWIGLTADGHGAVLGAMRGHVSAIRRYFFDVLQPDEADRLTDLSGRIVAAIGCGADEDAPPATAGSATEAETATETAVGILK